MRRRAALAAFAAAPATLLAACMSPQERAELASLPVHLIFFADDSVAVGPRAQTVIQDAANIATQHPNARVRVLGFVAPDPGQAPLVALSRARAEAVANELQRLGVAATRIRVEGRGAAPFSGPEAAIEARRVEIHIG
ncbi:OmpA family protein [Falsiroseomonas oryziterrae]|uniref:OmpA family protein n=1 Tax=Falsiroseomonas oryziterrae TaxID=2911368 RepID=UPI001F2251E0|nr:OmpA family protein [Roseomonas sp. NPKOSM-4]